MHRMCCWVVVLMFFAVFSGSVYCQTYGKVFTKTEADELFGPVLVSVKVNTDEIKNMMKETKNVLLFRINDNKVEYAGSDRVSLTNKSLVYDSKVVFKIVSFSVLEELLVKGGETVSYFEIRKDVVSITNGLYTLEKSSDCPPYCVE